MKFLILIAIAALLFAPELHAYVGPGAGVGVIGAIVGVVLAVIMAILGIFWYPIKRMFKKNSDEETLEEAEAINQDQEKKED